MQSYFTNTLTTWTKRLEQCAPGEININLTLPEKLYQLKPCVSGNDFRIPFQIDLYIARCTIYDNKSTDPFQICLLYPPAQTQDKAYWKIHITSRQGFNNREISLMCINIIRLNSWEILVLNYCFIVHSKGWCPSNCCRQYWRWHCFSKHYSCNVNQYTYQTWKYLTFHKLHQWV